jgi:hypothetical protein
MSNIFGSILEKLGIHKPETSAKTGAKPGAPAAAAKPPQGYPYVPPAAKETEMAAVDVAAHLDYLAKTGPIKGLNWKMSINDLMALLGLEHTPQAIKDLAVELGCPEKEMGDSYTRNVWTHKALLKKIAENGGKLPKELLD